VESYLAPYGNPDLQLLCVSHPCGDHKASFKGCLPVGWRVLSGKKKEKQKTHLVIEFWVLFADEIRRQGLHCERGRCYALPLQCVRKGDTLLHPEGKEGLHLIISRDLVTSSPPSIGLSVAAENY